jgi:ribosome-binding factor A
LETTFASLVDERLASVFVEEVSPAPNASRLLVVLRSFAEAETELEETRAALAGAEGLLRTEVAVAIHRKRTPHLHYVLFASGERDQGNGGERAEATE